MASGTSVLPKACENCRIRKVRCNRSNPCSNCEISSITCRPSSANTRRRIRHVESRKANPPQPDAAKSPRQGPTPVSDTSSQRLSRPDSNLDVLAEAAEQTSSSPAAVFEGSSSFVDQVRHANRAAGVVNVQGTHGASDTVQHGNELPRGLHEDEFSLLGKAANRTPLDLKLPSAPFVLDLLKYFKTHPSKVFLAFCFRDIHDLERLCKAAYFPVEPISLGATATMYGLLYFLIRELHIDSDNPVAQKYDTKADLELVEHNFHRIIETFEILVTPTYDNIKALTVAMAKTHGEKPHLCWSLTCAAVRQAISLGYHREASFKGLSFAEAEDRRFLFWWVYVFDKNLSLRLGCTSSIQDHDIDVQMWRASADPRIRPYDQVSVLFQELATIQGVIYNDLYSLKALKSSNEQRAASITKISAMMDRWYHDWVSLDYSQAVYPDFFEICFKIMEPIYHAKRAIINRASTSLEPPALVSPACYEAAVRSLQAYLKAFEDMKKLPNTDYVRDYADEILFWTSHIPLVIVFLHSISMPNHDDVELLVKFQGTLEHLKDASHEIARNLRVCKVFTRTARSSLKAYQDQTNATANEHGHDPLTDIQYAMHASVSRDPAALAPDDFGSYSTPEDFNFEQMSTYFSGWLETERPSADIFNLDFVHHP